MRNHPLQHTLLRSLRSLGIADRPLLLASSGGLDSMVLVDLVFALKGLIGSEVAVANVHHGSASSPDQNIFRQKSAELVANEAGYRGCEFFQKALSPSRSLSSENEYRVFRYESLFEVRQHWNSNAVILTGHHLDDLLETRFMRLLRGAGPQGMNVFPVDARQIFRPLSGVSREDLYDYAHQAQVPFLEDPSNDQVNPLRNWLRKILFPQIHKKSPGGVTRLGRSLELISESLGEAEGSPLGLIQEGKLNRSVFEAQSLLGKKKALAYYFRLEGLKNYSQNQMEEVLKRIPRKQREQSLSISGRTFIIGPDWLHFLD